MIYTGIGELNASVRTVIELREIGLLLARKDWVLRSGHETTCDIAFEEGSDEGEGKSEIYTADMSYRGDDKSTFHSSGLVREIAARYVTSWKKLSPTSKRYYVRNVHEILGFTLKEPSRMIICWTDKGEMTRRTAIAMKMSRDYHIELINLGLDRATDKQRIYELTSEKAKL